MGESTIHVFRNSYTLKSTIGHVFLGNSSEKFCYSLEDVVRGRGIKIKGHTAVPEGTYFWHITYSNRFKRKMISIYTEPNGYELKSLGISFKGIRMHGGNTHKNTEGCPLVAFNKLNNDTIQGTAEKELMEWAESVGGKGIINVKNKIVR
jgi:hypothetical protein